MENTARSMAKALETAQLARDFQEKSRFVNLPEELDAQPDPLKAMEACLPYVHRDYRQNFKTFIKLMEICRMLEDYGARARAISDRSADGDWRRGLLRAIRPYLGETQRETLSLFEQCMNIFEIIQTLGGETQWPILKK